MARAPLKKRETSGGGNYFAAPKSDVEFFSSGSKMLDLALGGGWAECRVGNVIGDKSAGKTLLMIEASANFLIKHKKGKVRYREAEKAWQDAYAAALGMPIDRVDFGEDHPIETVEDIFDELEWRSQNATQPELYIVDSLDSVSSRAEKKRGFDEDSYAGEKARKMSEMFRRLVGPIADRGITLIIVSQIRDKMNVRFGRKWTRTGGKALDFYASQTVLLKQAGRIYKTIHKLKQVVGVDIIAANEKNKVALPYRIAEFPIRFGYGIDDAESCVEWLKKSGGLGHENEALGNLRETVFLDAILSGEGDVRAMMDGLHKAVEARWWEIEERYLPKAKKYESIRG